MWRSIFIAFGIMAVIIGLEFLVIDSADFYAASQTSAETFANPLGTPSPSTNEWRPKDWYPWAALGLGAVVIIYAFTLPSRFRRAAA